MSRRAPLTLDPVEDGTQPLPPYGPLEGDEETFADREREIRLTNARWTARVIYFAFGVVEIVIAIRILLKLIAANETSGLARFIYGFTAPFLAPFQNVVGSPRARNGSIFEFSSLLAILIYMLISWLLVRLIFLLLDRPTLH